MVYITTITYIYLPNWLVLSVYKCCQIFNTWIYIEHVPSDLALTLEMRDYPLVMSK